MSSRNNKIGINKHIASLDAKIKRKINNNIYSIFKSLRGNKIEIVDVIDQVDFNLLKGKNYRRIKYSQDSLLKATLLMKLKNLKKTELIRYLQTHKREAKKLGFNQIPDRRTIGHFINHILDDRAKAMIDYIARKINEISNKFSIDLNIEPLGKPKRKISKSAFYIERSKKMRELSKLLKKRIMPFLDLNLKGNCIYKKGDFLDLLIHMALTQDFAENGSKTLKSGRRKVPNADTLLYHLKNYNDFYDLQRMFFIIYENIWEMARKENIFNPYRKYDVAIDFTDWLFYGDKTAPMVVGTQPKNGTDACYKFATINIVEGDSRFTLLALPVSPLDKKEDILARLIDYAKRRIKIRKVYLDRGFFTTECIKTLNKYKVNFLMPCTSISTIRGLLKISSAPSVIKNFSMRGVSINVLIIEENNQKYAFASNEEWDENDVDLADKVFRQYSKRWGIETSYRVKKHSFRPKTTSKNYYIRFFYFMFSVLMYNLWILLDIILCILRFGIKIPKHILTSKLFATLFQKIDAG
ncbi:MAG: transposase [Candidatus Thermoplasmatota archaeon]